MDDELDTIRTYWFDCDYYSWVATRDGRQAAETAADVHPHPVRPTPR